MQVIVCEVVQTESHKSAMHILCIKGHLEIHLRSGPFINGSIWFLLYTSSYCMGARGTGHKNNIIEV